MLKKRHANSLVPGPLFDGCPYGDEFCPIIQNFASHAKDPDSIKHSRSQRIIENSFSKIHFPARYGKTGHLGWLYNPQV